MRRCGCDACCVRSRHHLDDVVLSTVMICSPLVFAWRGPVPTATAGDDSNFPSRTLRLSPSPASLLVIAKW